jgi:hypothetical protein
MARTVLPYLLALHTAPRPYLLLSLPAGALPSTSSVAPDAATAEHDPMLPAQLLQYLHSAGVAEQLQVFAPAACGTASPLIAQLSAVHMLQSVRFLTCLAQRITQSSTTDDEGEAARATDFSPDSVLTREGATVVDTLHHPAPSAAALEYRRGEPLAPIAEASHESSVSPFTKSLDGVVQRLEASTTPTPHPRAYPLVHTVVHVCHDIVVHTRVHRRASRPPSSSRRPRSAVPCAATFWGSQSRGISRPPRRWPPPPFTTRPACHGVWCSSPLNPVARRARRSAW